MRPHDALLENGNAHLYVIGDPAGSGPVKIGFSHDPALRLPQIRAAENKPALEILWHSLAMHSVIMWPAEGRAHDLLEKHRLRKSEWFTVSAHEAASAATQAIEECCDPDPFFWKEAYTWLKDWRAKMAFFPEQELWEEFDREMSRRDKVKLNRIETARQAELEEARRLASTTSYRLREFLALMKRDAA